MKCLALLAENSKNIDKDIVNLYLTQFISLKTFVTDNSCDKSLQRSYLSILNHILHHTILVPNVKKKNHIFCFILKFKMYYFAITRFVKYGISTIGKHGLGQ